MIQKLVVNGQTYDSPDAMPPDVRQLYEAALRLSGATRPGVSVHQHHVVVVVNGKTVTESSELPPDARALIENLRATGPASGTSRTDIVVNGTHYASVDAMPADVRAEYDRAMAALAATSPVGRVGAAAVRRLLQPSATDEARSRPWRLIGWLIIAALAVIFWLNR